MSGHTPGPWKAVCGSVFRVTPEHLAQPEHDFYLLGADRRTSNGDGVSNPTRPHERDANVRLAAKAPELLDLLTRAVDLLEHHIEMQSRETRIETADVSQCTDGILRDANRMIASLND